jgi:hypothetical protein
MEVSRMKNALVRDPAIGDAKANWVQTDYKEGVRKLLEKEVSDMVTEEIKKGAQELLEEQRKAIKQLVEENKMAIQQVLGEEKKAVWAKMDDFRKSIVTMAYS